MTRECGSVSLAEVLRFYQEKVNRAGREYVLAQDLVKDGVISSDEATGRRYHLPRGAVSRIRDRLGLKPWQRTDKAARLVEAHKEGLIDLTDLTTFDAQEWLGEYVTGETVDNARKKLGINRVRKESTGKVREQNRNEVASLMAEWK